MLAENPVAWEWTKPPSFLEVNHFGNGSSGYCATFVLNLFGFPPSWFRPGVPLISKLCWTNLPRGGLSAGSRRVCAVCKPRICSCWPLIYPGLDQTTCSNFANSPGRDAESFRGTATAWNRYAPFILAPRWRCRKNACADAGPHFRSSAENYNSVPRQSFMTWLQRRNGCISI